MRAKEFLIESEGGMMRRAEEAKRGKRIAFKNQSGNVISMVDSQIIPQDNDPADDYNQIAQEILDYTSANGVSINDTLTLPALSGLSTPEKAAKNAKAGADVIVVGNAIEKDPYLIMEMAKAVHEQSNAPKFNLHQ